MKNYRWFYVVLGMLIFLCLGTVYSWSIFRKPLENVLHFSSTQSGLPFMTFLAFYAILMPFGGKLVTRYHPRTVMVLGGSLVGLGWFLASFAKSIWFLVLTYGVIAGSGVGIVYGVPISVVSRWFYDKKGLALGILLSGFGLSPFITAPIAKKFIDLYGVFTTFKILGGIFLIFIIILSLPFKFPDEIKHEEEISGSSLNPKEMLKTAKFYALWFCFMVGTLVGLMIIGITGPVGEEIIKIDSKKVALFVSIFSAFNGIGRPLFGWLTDVLKPVFVISLSYLLILLSSFLMFLFKEGSVVVFTLSFALFWLNFGGWLSIAPALTSRFFGNKFYSQNYGIVFTAYGFGAIIGNLLSGILKDYFGSYKVIAYPTIFIVIIAFIVANKFLKEENR
ncbi:Predicted arabinose efflux permease, MFS family [Caloramator fervidus]|uniref:Predicted arabinose efflux permease, MFS family n=1 Tax=Caloramator fervidus TaxID=29344 RepID=A0A1H5UBM5_9CLOT|nr:OFA family MFS transporter [Caloramator fervidus]SEF71731.1 Predicted arabinose efflux permease, MFS family [Caloramator fervidus]